MCERKKKRRTYVGPASMRRTFHRGFSVRRLARTAPALAVVVMYAGDGLGGQVFRNVYITLGYGSSPPTMMKSYVVFWKVEKLSERMARAGTAKERIDNVTAR